MVQYSDLLTEFLPVCLHAWQMKRVLEIPIVNDMVPEKDECFEVELFNPTGGARLGTITKMAVTITNDDGKVYQVSQWALVGLDWS